MALSMSTDWDTPGPPCPRCGRETFRFLGDERVCPDCHRRKCQEEARAMEHIAMALTYRVLPRRGRRPSRVLKKSRRTRP
jgi:rubredoxin